MARAADEIIAEIAQLRSWNREIYEAMREITPASIFEDNTLDLVRRAYLMNPDKAKSLHRRIAANDYKIWELTEELCA